MTDWPVLLTAVIQLGIVAVFSWFSGWLSHQTHMNRHILPLYRKKTTPELNDDINKRRSRALNSLAGVVDDMKSPIKKPKYSDHNRAVLGHDGTACEHNWQPSDGDHPPKYWRCNVCWQRKDET